MFKAHLVMIQRKSALLVSLELASVFCVLSMLLVCTFIFVVVWLFTHTRTQDTLESTSFQTNI